MWDTEIRTLVACPSFNLSYLHCLNVQSLLGPSRLPGTSLNHEYIFGVMEWICFRTFDVHAGSPLFGPQTLHPATSYKMNASSNTRFVSWYGPIAGPLIVQPESAAEPPYTHQAVSRVGNFESYDKCVRIAFQRVIWSVCSMKMPIKCFRVQEWITCPLPLKEVFSNVPDNGLLKISSYSRLWICVRWISHFPLCTLLPDSQNTCNFLFTKSN